VSYLSCFQSLLDYDMYALDRSPSPPRLSHFNVQTRESSVVLTHAGTLSDSRRPSTQSPLEAHPGTWLNPPERRVGRGRGVGRTPDVARSPNILDRSTVSASSLEYPASLTTAYPVVGFPAPPTTMEVDEEQFHDSVEELETRHDTSLKSSSEEESNNSSHAPQLERKSKVEGRHRSY
jgi:hypothetical protein